MEPLIRRENGDVLGDMVDLMGTRAQAFRELKRFDDARAAALKCFRFYEESSGENTGNIAGQYELTLISYDEGDLDMYLGQLEELRCLMRPKYDIEERASTLDRHATLLVRVERYQEAVSVREEHLNIVLLEYGADQLEYATSCIDFARLYAQLKQLDKAVEMASIGVKIRRESLGASNILTLQACDDLQIFQRARLDPVLKKKIALESYRLCNISKCGKVEKKMAICTHCNSYYLCKAHHETINEHMPVCPNHPDALWAERKVDEILKCRRCRKETKLMKCSVCGNVWYCGAQCQNEDWKRHKLVCGKK